MMSHVYFFCYVSVNCVTIIFLFLSVYLVIKFVVYVISRNYILHSRFFFVHIYVSSVF
jgi:hypothetical protein